ncbi:MAG: DUF2726 domain-containing protein [Phenylobacterium sp.]|uniref:DUF2726 domain-containing protein n=1 Tax=Phenylobacterium sp. TaxID=1871053 RepID=UPI003BB5A01A
MARLLDKYEELVHAEVQAVAARFDLSVFPKVRVADVLEPETLGVTGALKSYALASHFDFVICRNKFDTAYAIEFDGASHAAPKQIERDAKKDRLCQIGDFPLLRINSQHLSKRFGPMSLLAWLMEVHEMQLAFYEAQTRGEISPDEDFDPFWLMSMDPGEARFPYSFAAKARYKLQVLKKRGKIVDGHSSGFVGRGTDGVLHGYNFIRVTPETAITVKSSMRPHRFPAPLMELLDEILAVLLTEEVDLYLAGQIGALPVAEVVKRWTSLRSGLSMGSTHTAGFEGFPPPERRT